MILSRYLTKYMYYFIVKVDYIVSLRSLSIIEIFYIKQLLICTDPVRVIEFIIRVLFHLCVFIVRQMCIEQRGSRITLSHCQSTGLKNLSYDKNAQMK